MTKRRTLAGALARWAAPLIALVTLASAGEPPIVERDIAYVDGGGARQSLDLAVPHGAAQAPLVVIVHGGSWRSGDKASAAPIGRRFLARGFAAAAVNYRLHPEADPAAMASDVAAAVAWLQKNAPARRVDPDRIFLVGHSAGAHLVSLIGTDARYLENAGAEPLAGVIALDTGLYDVGAQIRATSPSSAYGRDLRAVFGEDEAFWRRVSPLAQARENIGPMPPFLVVASDDRADIDRQAKPFVAVLTDKKTPARLFVAEGHTHQSLYRDFGEEGDAVTAAALAFMEGASVIQRAAAPSSTGIEWGLSFQAPQTDGAGKRLTGTEVMGLAVHDRKLFAGNSYWNETREPRRGQIFRLDAANGRWTLDYEMPPRYSRVASILSATFSKDREGAPIEPFSVLVAGATFDKGSKSAGPAGLFLRQPDGRWVRRDLGSTAHPFAYTQIRSLGQWRDTITGADLLLVGANPAPLGIFVGAADVRAPGGLRFAEAPEFTPRGYERIMGFAGCGGVLYAATQRQILRRLDGPSPRWEVLIDLAAVPDIKALAQDLHDYWRKEDDIRSFRCDPASASPRLLFSALNRAFAFDPAAIDAKARLTVEADYAALFRAATGRPVHYIQAQDTITVENSGGRVTEWIGAEAFYDPDYLKSGKARFPHWKSGFGKDAWMIVREVVNGAASFRFAEVRPDNRNLDDAPLARVRGFARSPFPGEPDAIYTAGFAPWFEKVSNTGWILRGELTDD